MTCGPRTQISPSAPTSRSSPVSGSTMRISVLGAVTPTDPGLNWPAGVMCETGDSSVMP